MSRRKVSTTIYITPEQNEQLKALHDATKVPIAEYIRQQRTLHGVPAGAWLGFAYVSLFSMWIAFFVSTVMVNWLSVPVALPVTSVPTAA